MRPLLRTAIFSAAALCVAACGDGSGSDSNPAERADLPPQASKNPPGACGRGQAEGLLNAFMAAVNSGDESQAVRYVAPQPELYRLALYTGPEPGGEVSYPRTPAAVYRGMRMLTHGEDFALVEAMVGVAPRADRRVGPRADDPAAGVDFAYESERRSISGKVGYNCATEQIYAGAMNVRRG